MQEIIQVLQKLIQDNFDDSSIVVFENTVLEAIEEWDSMEQVNVITMVEEHFGFKFTVSEMTAMSNAKKVCEMAEIIEKKLN